MLPQILIGTIERLMDAHGLIKVLKGLQVICRERADQADRHHNDGDLWEAWIRFAFKLDDTIEQAEKLGFR